MSIRRNARAALCATFCTAYRTTFRTAVRTTSRAVACTALLLSIAAAAQEAKVRVSLSTDKPVWVGQGVTLSVDLLVPGYFAGAPSFDLPDPQGVLLMPPRGRPLVTTENIDGTQYSVQEHEVRAWPMRAGEQSIPAFNVRFAFKRNALDTVEVPVTLTTTVIALNVKLPPGAEYIGSVISARNLQVSDAWSPEPGAAPVKAGAAFTRTITFTAPDVPGMVFPPFPTGKIDGLGIYNKRQLLDEEQRGSLLGMRKDTITYIAKRPGQFTIPAVQFTWFDLAKAQLRTETLPARTLNVVANSQLASADGASLEDTTRDHWSSWLYALRSWASSWQNIATLSVALFAVLILLLPASRRRFGRGLRAVIAPLRAVRLQSLNPTEKARRRQR